MMIAFITIKSSLVPLIEGLCAQIYFRFEISVVCSHLLLFFFAKEKTCSKKMKRQSLVVHFLTCSLAYIYTCVLRKPHGIYVYYRYSTSRFLPLGSPGVSSRRPGSHLSTPHAVCVRVRAQTHTTHTHQPPVKKSGDTSVAHMNPSRCKKTPTESWKKLAHPSFTYECNGV